MPLYAVIVSPDREQAIVDKVDENDLAKIFPGAFFVLSDKATAQELSAYFEISNDLLGVVIKMGNFSGHGTNAVAEKIRTFHQRNQS